MNLDELTALAHRHHRRGQWLKRVQACQDDDAAQLLAELDRRKKTSIEHAGVSITKTSKRYGFFLDVLKVRLRPSVFRRVTRLEPDAEALRRELKAGNLTAEDLDAAERRSRPWPVVTLTDEAA